MARGASAGMLLALIVSWQPAAAEPDLGVVAEASSGPTITQFVLPTTDSWPTDVAAGPGGTVWVTEMSANKVAKASVTGSGVTIQEFWVPTSASQPDRIAAGPDGNMWFTERNAQEVSKVTSAGSVTSYVWPNFNYPTDIVAGPDGNLWVPGGNSDKVSQSTTAGVVTPFDLPVGRLPVEIANGPDGNLWVTEPGGNRVARVSTTGTYVEYTLPTAASEPRAITVGPDDNLWVVEKSGDQVARVTTNGGITEYALPTVGSAPWGIAAGPDGNLWVTETTAGQLARVTPNGDITEYALPIASSHPLGIATGPDGNLWVAVPNTNSLWRVDPMATVAFAATPSPVQENVGTAHLTVTRSGDASSTSTVHYAGTGGSAASGSDFTLAAGDLVFAPGQTTASIAVPIVNDSVREGSETVVVTLSAPSAGTRLGTATSTTLAIRASDQRPDGWISTASASRFIGNNIYNTTAARQTRTVTARRTKTRTFYVRVYNDGNVTNTFAVKGSAAPSGSRLHYYEGSKDVTTSLRSAAGLKISCAPDRYVAFRMVVKITTRAAIGSTKAANITATWTGDGTRADRVRGMVRVVR